MSPRSQGPRGPRRGPRAPASHPRRHGRRPHGTGEARCTPRGHQKDVDGTPGSGSSSEAERGPPGAPPFPLGSHRGPLPGRPHLMGRQRVLGSHASPTRTLRKPFAQLGTALSFWSAVEGGGRARVSAASLSEPGWPPACCPGPGGSRHRRTVDRPPRPRRPPAGLTVLVCFPRAVFAKCPWNAPLLPAELQQERRGGG